MQSNTIRTHSFRFPSRYYQKLFTYNFLLLTFVLLVPHAKTEIHKWVDENGKVHYGDKPPKQLTSAQQSSSITKSNSPSNIQLETRPLETVGGGAQNSVVLRIRNHFVRQEFQAAENILLKLQMRAEVNIANESELHRSLYAFNLNDQQYSKLFQQWIEQSPNSYFAHLAKAHFLFRFGWDSRGGKWNRGTSQAQFQSMKNYFAEATAILKRSETLNPSSVLPHVMYISMANAVGDAKTAKRYLTAGLKLKPSSYELRKTYMHSIKPRWGGSLEQMKVFANNAQYYADKNPNLKRLLGESTAESGAIAYSKKQYDKAYKLFSKALLHGDDPEYYFKRAKAGYRLAKYSKAIIDLNAAIKLNPEIADYYKWRYYSYAKLKKYNKALHDIKRAALLSPSDQSINDILLKTLAQANAPGDKPKLISALNSKLFEFDAQLKVQPNNDYLYYQKGHFLLTSNLYAQSEKPLRHAIKLAPAQFDYYRALDLALFKQDKLAQIIEFWEQYIALKPNDGRAYLERAGTFYHMQNYRLAKLDAKKALDLGITDAEPLYKKLMSL